MIPIKTITISTPADSEELISRLNWKLHKGNKLIWITSKIFNETNKPLAGYMNNNEFTIVRIRPFYKQLLPLVTLNGKVSTLNGQTSLKITFRPGLFTTVFLLFIFYSTFILGKELLSMPNSLENIVVYLIWVLLFPGTATILTYREANKTKEILLEILGVK
jgi:hypothetical protein